MRRRIDTFTDTHRSVGESRRIIGARFGHYSRIIADIFFDHFLVLSWDDYVAEPLDGFLARTFALIDENVAVMPDGLLRIYPRMRDGSWYRSYASLEGRSRALAHTSARISPRPHLTPPPALISEAGPALPPRTPGSLWTAASAQPCW